MPSAVSPSLVACLAAVVTALAAAVGAVLARGSTAVPAAAWAAVAATTLACEMGCRAAGGLTEPSASAAARLCVAALALCPTMSLLGAKRPQHGVWQFIVASLAVVLAMPAISATLVRPGTLPDIHVLQRGLMLVVAVVGWMNFIGTRNAVAATFVAAGQLVLMRPLFSSAAATAGPAGGAEAAAAVAIAAGSVLAAAQAARAARVPRSAAAGIAACIDGPFLAVRELLGAAWTLRIAERFNAIAAARGWPARLHFGGLQADGEPGGDAGAAGWHRDAVRAFRALVRRFVTPAWLRRHGWL
jgi:hypothetical protein